VLQVAPSTYYAARDRVPSARAQRDSELVPRLVELWKVNYEVYGSRKLWKAARRAARGRRAPAPRRRRRVVRQAAGVRVESRAMPTTDSDSSVQSDAETLIRAKVEEHVGKSLAPARLKLPSGAVVIVDGAAEDESVLVEIFARQGTLKGGQRRKVAQDALKLITLHRSRPDAQLILAFADEAAAAYATKGTWLAEALAMWGVAVLVVELDDETRAGIKAAQVKQIMVNPGAPAPAVSAVGRC